MPPVVLLRPTSPPPQTDDVARPTDNKRARYTDPACPRYRDDGKPVIGLVGQLAAASPVYENVQNTARVRLSFLFFLVEPGKNRLYRPSSPVLRPGTFRGDRSRVRRGHRTPPPVSVLEEAV